MATRAMEPITIIPQLYACQTVSHPHHGWGTVRRYSETRVVINTRAGEVEVDRTEIIVPQAAKPVPKPPRAIPQVDTTAPWAALAADIARGPYRLEVQTKHDFLDEVQYEYLSWCDEILPEDAIHVYENRPTNRCWRLFFPLPSCSKIPFPIEIGGVTGRHPTGTPRGLLYKGRVDVYFAELVEQLVRAGLRVTI